MRVFSAECPHCKTNVDTTVDKLGEPIACPNCGNPFEMDIPSAAVASVREEEEETSEKQNRLAGEMEERNLITAHPVMFRAHPFYFLGLVLLLALGVFGVLQPLLGIVAGDIWTSPIIMWAGVAFIVVALIALLAWWIRVLNVTLTITESRTILQKGIIARETSEVQHDDVRNIQLDQSIAERLFHYGDIGISSSGQDDLEIVAHEMPQPERIVQIIRDNQD